MKNTILIRKNLSKLKFCIFVCLSLNSANFAFAKSKSIIHEHEQSVIKTEPSEIREIYPPFKYYKDRKGEITYSQMKEDLDYFKFLMKDIYAGYEFAESKGMNLNRLVSEIEEKYAGNDTVYSRDIAKDIWANLKNYINDHHFTVFFDKWASESEKNLIYYTDIYLDDSEVEAFKKANPELEVLPYCSGGILKNRVAKLSSKPITQIEVNGLNSSRKQTNVTLYRVNPISYTPKFTEKETPSTAYIHLESFRSDGSKGQDITFQKFISASSRYKDKENIILDLRSNTGGNPKYVEDFIKWLVFDYNENLQTIDNTFEKKICEIKEGNFRKETYTFVKYYYYNIQGIIEQKKKEKIKLSAYERTYEKNLIKELDEKCKIYQKNPEIKYLKTNYFDESLPCLENFPETKDFSFKGKLIILLDRHSASASEEMVLLTKKIFGEDKVIVAGENSWGCLEYATVYDYLLPNSKIGLHLGAECYKPAMDKLSTWHGESKGVFPDIWSNDEDMLETLVFITKDEGLRKVLNGMH